MQVVVVVQVIQLIQTVGGSINASSISKGDTVVSYDVEINDYIETKMFVL